MTAHNGDFHKRMATRRARGGLRTSRRSWLEIVVLAALCLLPAPAAAQSAQVSLQATPSPFVPNQSIAIIASGQISWSPMLWCTQPCYPVAAYSTIQIWGTGGYYAFADAWDEEVALQTISGLNPTAAITGTAVTISGSHFTGTQGTVTFNGTGASITGWSDTSITATVPGSATTGVVIVIGERRSPGHVLNSCS